MKTNKRLVSAPGTRALRFLQNQSQSDLISNIDVSGIDVSHRYPECVHGRYRNFLINAVWKYKEFVDISKKAQGNPAFGKKLKTKTRIAVSVLSRFRFLLDWAIVQAFRSDEYDRIVSLYQEIQINTIVAKSEAYLYSSAIRHNKPIYYGIDGWDCYYALWFPMRCDYYESWGDGIFRSLFQHKKDALTFRNRAPFKQYDIKNNNKTVITVFEGSRVFSPPEYQIDVLRKIVVAAKKTGLGVIFKTVAPPNSIIDNDEVIATGAELFVGGGNLSDHSQVYDDSYDELHKLIEKSALFISFRASHGVLEFGVNSVPALIVMSSPEPSFPLQMLQEAEVPQLPGDQLEKLDQAIHQALTSPQHLERIINFQ